jgi:beta-N-acetylhexosaminidase
MARRAGAVAVVVALGVCAWLLFRSDDESGGPAEIETELSGPVSDLVSGMSTEDLVDQVLLLGFDGTDSSAPFVDELRERQLGGVIVASENWIDATAGTALVDELRSAASEGGRTEPLFVVSQEGGEYRALPDLPPEQTQLLIGDADSVAGVQQWATETSAALVDAGFDLNLFPVADVATLDSPVADRAFSDDAGAVSTLTVAALRGCREEGLACAPVHFPGLGAASQDTSRGPATVSLDAASLSSRDLEPFRAAFAEGAPAVVVSLAFYGAYDTITPGALAEPVATGLLRDELGFDGAAITDDLGSGAVRATGTTAKAAVKALAAGSDLLQIGSSEDQVGVREEILSAVESGELSQERLAQAAGRVLELKRAQGLLDR